MTLDSMPMLAGTIKEALARDTEKLIFYWFFSDKKKEKKKNMT